VTKLFSAGGSNPIHLQGAELLDGIVSPAFGVNQNDLVFDATANGCLLRIRLSIAISITGLSSGQANRLVLLQNDSAFNLTLPDRSGASLSFNQFNNGGASIVLLPGGFAYYLYNPRISLWDLLQLNTGAAGGGGGGPSGYLSAVVAAGAQNDYNPGGGFPAGIGRLDLNPNAGATTLNGLAAGADNQTVIVSNINGANNLTLANQNAGSAAANRFRGVADTVLVPGGSTQVTYYTAVSRWVIVP
jgi:hypothetical protein